MLTLLQRSDRKQIEDFLESEKPQNGIYDYMMTKNHMLRPATPAARHRPSAWPQVQRRSHWPHVPTQGP
jgi:hypothetical protein